MRSFKQFINEMKITKRDGRHYVWDKDGKLLGNYDSEEAAKRHEISKDKGIRK